MIRCPSCRKPNPSGLAHCGHCGAAMPPAPPPGPWLDLPAFRACLGPSALLTLAAAALTPLLLSQGLLATGAFHLIMGLGLGACVAQARGEGWRLVWAGLAGGALSSALDFFYTGGFFVYKAVWYLLYWFMDENQSLQAKDVAYGLLQALRLAGTALVLAALVKAGALRLQAFLLLALAARFFVRQGFLTLPWTGARTMPIFLYFTSVFLLLYGMAPSTPVDANSRK